MNGLPQLKTRSFLAFITDNSPLSIHRAGYNGVASLIPWRTGNNLLVPFYAGLNYELISLPGLPPYDEACDWKFEPRCEPMHIEAADEDRVVLVQPETSHAHVSARITFTTQQPHYLHQRIELQFHRRFCAQDEPNVFSALFASYIHAPADLHIYTKPDLEAGGDLDGWLGITREGHGASTYLCRPLPAEGEIDPSAHLEAMKRQEPTADQSPTGESLTFYYGLCHEEMFLMMFKRPEKFRLAYSPCGAGQEPAWNPAWDYVLHLDDARLGTPYAWDLCLAVKPYAGRADALTEVRDYLAG